jgi:hypothetical protein
VPTLVAGIPSELFIENVDAHWNSSLNHPNMGP